MRTRGRLFASIFGILTRKRKEIGLRILGPKRKALSKGKIRKNNVFWQLTLFSFVIMLIYSNVAFCANFMTMRIYNNAKIFVYSPFSSAVTI